MMLTREKYSEIKGELDLNFRDDGKARDLLDSMLAGGDFSVVEKAVRGKTVFVLGCGPSLKKDVAGLAGRKTLKKAVLIAADGAVKALLERNVVPNLCVTDLDGDKKTLIKASKLGCVMIVHAHGDNMAALHAIVPKLAGKKLGTTQVESTKKIKNLGGFTDGDRAVHLAVKYKAKKIILFGMDFGRTRKLQVGKKLLEELAGKTRIPILNATSRGMKIKNVKRASLESLKLE
jgi:uncharacterized Rossmann fold enzyme